MSLMGKISRVTRSPRGQQLIGKARRFANDPKTRAKVEEARGKLGEGLDQAKHRLAERRGRQDEQPSQTAAPPPPPPPTDDGPRAA